MVNFHKLGKMSTRQEWTDAGEGLKCTELSWNKSLNWFHVVISLQLVEQCRMEFSSSMVGQVFCMHSLDLWGLAWSANSFGDRQTGLYKSAQTVHHHLHQGVQFKGVWTKRSAPVSEKLPCSRSVWEKIFMTWNYHARVWQQASSSVIFLLLQQCPQPAKWWP